MATSKEEAISNFNSPDYIATGEDGYDRLFWFGGMLMWRSTSTTTNRNGIFESLKIIDDILFEVRDNGHRLQRCLPDVQVKWRMYSVDNILLGDGDGQR